MLLPFQHLIAKRNLLLSSNMSSFIQYVDEITIIVFIPLALMEFLRNKEIRDWLYLIVLFSLFIFGSCGLISGLINKNNLHVTILGSLDYIRNYFVIFIYAAFFREIRQFNKTFRLLLTIAVFIGFIAILQELWAITYNYYFTKDSHSKIFLMLKNILPAYPQYESRFGIYRVPSLMDNFNFLGLYCLLILTMYLYTAKKVGGTVFLALYSGIFVSVSRMVYLGFAVISGLHLFRAKKKRILIISALIPILLLMLKLSSLWDFNLSQSIAISQISVSDNMLSEPDLNYRKYSRGKAIEIWLDHPFWGVGPGIFGGIFSVKFESHVYDEYNFIPNAMALLKSWKHIDQFWPMILAEMGIIGTAGFAGLIVSLFVILFIAQSRATLDEMNGLFAGSMAFLIVVFIYSLGTVINTTQVIFPFFALIGMGLGCQKANRC